MKSHVRFTTDIKVSSKPFKNGEVVPVASIDAGCLQSLLRLGQVVECDAPKPDPKPEPKPEPKANVPAKPEIKK